MSAAKTQDVLAFQRLSLLLRIGTDALAHGDVHNARDSGNAIPLPLPSHRHACDYRHLCMCQSAELGTSRCERRTAVVADSGLPTAGAKTPPAYHRRRTRRPADALTQGHCRNQRRLHC